MHLNRLLGTDQDDLDYELYTKIKNFVRQSITSYDYKSFLKVRDIYGKHSAFHDVCYYFKEYLELSELLYRNSNVKTMNYAGSIYGFYFVFKDKLNIKSLEENTLYLYGNKSLDYHMLEKYYNIGKQKFDNISKKQHASVSRRGVLSDRASFIGYAYREEYLIKAIREEGINVVKFYCENIPLISIDRKKAEETVERIVGKF